MTQPLLYGLHDREARDHIPAGGWCVDTLALSEHPAPMDYAAMRGDINWIVRLNWGYSTTGTIPLPEQYQEFANRCAEYVARTRGCDRWIIGNEPNHEQERPNGVYITPEQYARCFVLCRDAIKRARPDAQVIPAACAPYHANPVSWLEYWHNMLDAIAGNGGCDGLAVHTYTRSSNPDDIDSMAKMGSPLENTYSGFGAYEDALFAVPDSMRRLPAYITEFNELLPDGWHDANTGVVQAAYVDIDLWNRSETVPPLVHCLILYRWPPYDRWYIEGKQGVIDDFNEAVRRGYQSPPMMGASAVVTNTYLPSVPNQSPSAPDLPLEWDPRLDRRGVRVVDTPVSPGQSYWELVKARWWDEKESQGRHHIYVEAIDENGKPLADVPFSVMWPTGMDRKMTNGKSGWDAGNYPMSKSLNEFKVSMSDGLSSDLVTGIGMGANGNSGIHTSTGLTFQRVKAKQAAQPTQPTKPQPPTKPAEPQPIPTGIIEPRVAQAILQIESGGRTHGENGKPIIRFESHIFRQKLGNDALWSQHFRADPQKPWTNQLWRPDSGEWRDLHTGSQASEWAAYEFAKTLNPEAAAQSISMGAAQIMGFNHARIGYPSAQAMLQSFQSAPMQIIGFINFFLSDHALMDAVHDRDWFEVAKRYNGAGNADHYAALLQKAYEGLG